MLNDYIHKIMLQLSHILYYGSHRDTSKNEILDLIKEVIKDYNQLFSGSGNEVQIKDFREDN